MTPATRPAKVYQYELSCGHVVENTEAWPAGTRMRCGQMGQPGTHTGTVVRRLRVVVSEPAPDLGTHADLPDPVHGGDVFSRIDASQEG